MSQAEIQKQTFKQLQHRFSHRQGKNAAKQNTVCISLVEV